MARATEHQREVLSYARKARYRQNITLLATGLVECLSRVPTPEAK